MSEHTRGLSLAAWLVRRDGELLEARTTRSPNGTAWTNWLRLGGPVRPVHGVTKL